jgi:hypothetical protein
MYSLVSTRRRPEEFSSAVIPRGMEVRAKRSRARALRSVGELWPFLQVSLAIAFLFSLNGNELSASDFAPTPRSGSLLA